MRASTPELFTIGHSGHSLEAFLSLLALHAIDEIADVRSAPYSRRYPWFGREPLARALARAGISYRFLGRELGARSVDPACHDGGRVRFPLLAASPLFLRGIDEALRAATERRVALLCAEKEPLDCHRTILVAPALAARGAAVAHILADGSCEPHAASLERLCALHGLADADLFRSRDESIALSLARQEERIAWRRERPAEDRQEVGGERGGEVDPR